MDPDIDEIDEYLIQITRDENKSVTDPYGIQVDPCKLLRRAAKSGDLEGCKRAVSLILGQSVGGYIARGCRPRVFRERLGQMFIREAAKNGHLDICDYALELFDTYSPDHSSEWVVAERQELVDLMMFYGAMGDHVDVCAKAKRLGVKLDMLEDQSYRERLAKKPEKEDSSTAPVHNPDRPITPPMMLLATNYNMCLVHLGMGAGGMPWY